jgi:hypothetical protein
MNNIERGGFTLFIDLAPYKAYPDLTVPITSDINSAYDGMHLGSKYTLIGVASGMVVFPMVVMVLSPFVRPVCDAVVRKVKAKVKHFKSK